MGDVVRLMTRRKAIALIAHDNCKTEMLEWARVLSWVQVFCRDFIMWIGG